VKRNNIACFVAQIYRLLKPGADDGFLTGEIENIAFTPTKIHGFLSASSADGGQSSAQSFVRMTSAPAMIGYIRAKCIVFFFGFTRRRRRTNIFMRGSFVHVTSEPAMIG
jgi:hypothetical protein